jgi:Subtilase family
MQLHDHLIVFSLLSYRNSAHMGNPLNYPAAYDSTISVAAVDDNKQWAFFSTFNDGVDIAAAGVDILSSVPGNTVGMKSGTSMAAPLVAGTAALLFRQCPSCGRSDVEDCLLATAAPLDCPRYMCGVGLLQTSTAMTCITSQTCCGGSGGGEYNSGTPFYDSDADDTSNTDSSTYIYSADGNTNNAKGSTTTKVDTDKIPSTGGGAGGAGGGAAKDTQDDNKNDVKDDNKNNDAPEDYDASEDYAIPGSETCLASKSGCYFPTMCCSGVCTIGMYASIGKCL